MKILAVDKPQVSSLLRLGSQSEVQHTWLRQFSSGFTIHRDHERNSKPDNYRCLSWRTVARCWWGKSAGQREYIPTIAKVGIIAGADGLFLETHPSPEGCNF